MTTVVNSVAKPEHVIYSNVEQMKSAVPKQMAAYVSRDLIGIKMASVSGKPNFSKIFKKLKNIQRSMPQRQYKMFQICFVLQKLESKW